MCLIIHREQGQADMPKSFWEDVPVFNKDGWGIMWNKRGIPTITKGMEFNDFWNLYRSLETNDVEFMVHFRKCTAGAVSIDNTHPFPVFDWEFIGNDPTKQLYLMHNGAYIKSPEAEAGYTSYGADIYGIGYLNNNQYDYRDIDERSDTIQFVESLIRPMLMSVDNVHDFIRSEAFHFMMETICDYDNRLAILDKDGIVKYNTGIWSRTSFGVTVSNSYAYDAFNPTVIAKSKTTTFTPKWKQNKDKAEESVEESRSYSDVKKVTVKEGSNLPSTQIVPDTPDPYDEYDPEEVKVLTEADLDYLEYYCEQDPEYFSDIVYNNPDEAIQLFKHILRA